MIQDVPDPITLFPDASPTPGDCVLSLNREEKVALAPWTQVSTARRALSAQRPIASSVSLTWRERVVRVAVFSAREALASMAVSSIWSIMRLIIFFGSSILSRALLTFADTMLANLLNTFMSFFLLVPLGISHRPLCNSRAKCRNGWAWSIFVVLSARRVVKKTNTLIRDECLIIAEIGK